MFTEDGVKKALACNGPDNIALYINNSVTTSNGYVWPSIIYLGKEKVLSRNYKELAQDLCEKITVLNLEKDCLVLLREVYMFCIDGSKPKCKETMYIPYTSINFIVHTEKYESVK